MELTLHDLQVKEILQFMGNANGTPDAKMLSDIEEMKTRIISISKPRYVYKCFALQDGILQDVDFFLEGRDIQRLLKASHHCIFLAVTLGSDVDKEMQRLQLRDMGKAFVFDCCASAAIEHSCDQIQKALELQYYNDGMYLTDRYSCGYGDLPITLQKDFLRVIDAQKRIGLYVNDSCILHPMKSVTAILGIADSIQPAILRGCAYCLLKQTCEYRKGGTTCGK